MADGTRRVAVVGLGLVGRQRVAAFEALQSEGLPVEVVAVHDVVSPVQPPAAPFAKTLDDVFAAEPDLVVVSLPHDVALDTAHAVLANSVDVFVEKPLGRTVAEGAALQEAARHARRRLHVGLNYRFMPGVAALLADAEAGWFGEVISVEMTLGHGGAPGDEVTWKLDPVRAGGGCLIDPGIHLLDLARLLAGSAVEVRAAMCWCGHWRTGIEEECHLLLSAATVPIFNIAVSVVRWRSTFVLRVNGVEGYGVVSGRGRSYGPQRYVRGRRWGWRQAASQADSEELVCEVAVDESFKEELRALLAGSFGGRTGVADDGEALEAMALLEACRQGVAGDIRSTVAR